MSKNSNNFWIAYADLMAGLLFVFVLLIGVIITKSFLLKNTISTQDRELSQGEKLLLKQKMRIHALEEEIKRLLAKNQEQNGSLHNLSNQILVLQHKLDSSTTLNQELNQSVIVLNDALKEQESRLVSLDSLLNSSNMRYSQLQSKLAQTKEEIKALTGIRLHVIKELKRLLGNKISIDENSGALRLSSNILFDKGEYVLKQSSKSELKSLFIEYIKALMNNKSIQTHIDKIVIEGHTDSDGEFLFNLELSQKRAYAVMNYLLGLDFVKEHHLKNLMVASGRSYLDLIEGKGKEDKAQSRRIEIKFMLKNKEAMQEIERILDAK